jgi:recombinational DNA repair protein (RecF pathway)
MNYICELHHKLSPNVNDLSELGTSQAEQIFTCLSNTLYLLDSNLEKKIEIKKIMLSKLIYFLGVLPDAHHCCFCAKSLNQEKSFLFYEEGQASCADCLGEAGNHPGAWVVAGFYQSLSQVLQEKFQVSLSGTELNQIDDIILEKYLWQHFQLKKENFKSLTWQNLEDHQNKDNPYVL